MFLLSKQLSMNREKRFEDLTPASPRDTILLSSGNRKKEMECSAVRIIPKPACA